jgi:O-antigen/teichoic acid export membrane protein
MIATGDHPVAEDNIDKNPQVGGARALLAGTAWLAGDSVFRLLAGLAVGIWVARYLGPQDLGRLAYCLAYVALFVPLAQAGLDRIAVRQLAIEDERDAGETMGCVFAVRLAAALAAAAAAIALFPLVSTDPVQQAMVWVMALGLLFLSCDAFDFWFRSRLQMRAPVLGRNVGFALAALARVLLILLGAGLFWFAAAGVLEAAAAALALWLLYRRSRSPALVLRFSARRSLELARESGFAMAYGVVIIVQARIDQLMLAQLAGPAQLGQYSAALAIVEGLTFLPVAVLGAMSPLLARLRASEGEGYAQELLNLYRWAVVLFLPLGLLLAVFSGTIVELLYGAAYAPAAPLLALLTLRLLLAFIGVARSAYVLNEKLFALSFASAAAGAALNVLLNLAWIPLWGAQGAVWASTLSFFLTTIVADLLFARTRPNFVLMARGLLTPWRARMIGSPDR